MEGLGWGLRTWEWGQGSKGMAWMMSQEWGLGTWERGWGQGSEDWGQEMGLGDMGWGAKDWGSGTWKWVWEHRTRGEGLRTMGQQWN